MRKDISQWLIHFVHRRNPENDPTQWFEEFVHVPVAYDDTGRPIETDWQYYDQEHPIAPDDYAVSVLHKILDDGHIRATWSFRNEKPTIYGPRAAVCFTEMPLYALLDYARSRADEDSVQTYGIAIPKHELFAAGARPVIYGLTSDHAEAREGDPYYKVGGRILAHSCGIAPHEQYRYVAMSLGGSKVIDWSHEREWRWTKSFSKDPDIPGLSLWLAKEDHKFSRIVILVHTEREAEWFLDRLKTLHDNPYNKYDWAFSKVALERTNVLALENISKDLALNDSLRLEDLQTVSLKGFFRTTPSPDTVEKVKRAVAKARSAAKLAADANPSNGLFGFACVVTYDAQTEVTEALLALKLAESTGDRYRVDEVMKDVHSSMIDTLEAAAEVAADILTTELGQKFIMSSRLD